MLLMGGIEESSLLYKREKKPWLWLAVPVSVRLCPGFGSPRPPLGFSAQPHPVFLANSQCPCDVPDSQYKERVPNPWTRATSQL